MQLLHRLLSPLVVITDIITKVAAVAAAAVVVLVEEEEMVVTSYTVEDRWIQRRIAIKDSMMAGEVSSSRREVMNRPLGGVPFLNDLPQ